MRPLRRKFNQKVTYDPDTGQDRQWHVEQSQDYKSDEGSIDSDGFVRIIFKDCGCEEEIGGRCFECGAVSCKNCHGRCGKCNKPICLQHSHFMKMDNGEKLRLCGEHYDELSRKRQRQKVANFFLSFFMEPKENPNE